MNWDRVVNMASCDSKTVNWDSCAALSEAVVALVVWSETEAVAITSKIMKNRALDWLDQVLN